MRVLLIDQENQCLDLALRAIAAGHEVRLVRYSPRKPIKDGDGFPGLKFVDDWRNSMDWVGKDGLIYTSGNFVHMTELDRYREFGFHIFSPTAASARLEIERGEGLKAAAAAGIEMPPYQEFASLEDAEKAARKSDLCFVFKTLGSENDKSLSFVADTPAEMVGWIRQKIDRGMKLKGPCILQEKIDMLAEVGVSAWMGPEGFLPGRYNVYFEHKKLLPGEIGPNTGEMGTVCQYTDTDKLATEMLKPMEPVLRALGHCGDFAVGAGIDNKGRAFLFEFTARAGWPAMHIQVASHRGDPIKWMADLLRGKDSLKVSNDVAIGVVCGQPFFPYSKSIPADVEGNPISGLDDAWPDVHPVGVMLGKGPIMRAGKIVDGPQHQTTGEYVVVCTGLGKTVEKARKKVYGVVDKVKFPNMIFRQDIGEKMMRSLPKLHAFGVAESMEAY